METPEQEDGLTRQIIGAAMRVHSLLGPGLLESAYEACLEFELREQGLEVERQKELPLIYRNIQLDCGYRLDLLVQNVVVVELKSVDELMPIHAAQVITYLKLSGYRVGLLINFNVERLRKGIRRIVYDPPASSEVQ